MKRRRWIDDDLFPATLSKSLQQPQPQSLGRSYKYNLFRALMHFPVRVLGAAQITLAFPMLPFLFKVSTQALSSRQRNFAASTLLRLPQLAGRFVLLTAAFCRGFMPTHV